MALVFVFSTTVHEASHALAAKLGGDPTAYQGGQMTLDPLPHIKRSPIGMVVVPIVSFFFLFKGWMLGWASAPYDPYWANRHPRRASIMALAGPASNFLIVLVSLIIIRIGLANDWFVFSNTYPFLDGPHGSFIKPVANLVSHFFTLNIILGVFNLIPLPPLDGAQGILIFFSESKAREISEKLQSLGMFGLVLAWIIFNGIGGRAINFGWSIALW